jgi:hypothetical protein
MPILQRSRLTILPFALLLLDACSADKPTAEPVTSLSADSIQLAWQGDSIVIGRQRNVKALFFGDTVKLKSEPLEWSSSDTSVAIVDANG